MQTNTQTDKNVEIPEEYRERAIVFFDGVCRFCNGSVNFILANEKTHSTEADKTPRELLFSPLQAETAKEVLPKYGVDPNALDSVLFLENGHLWKSSTAALKIAGYLKSPYHWLHLLTWIPEIIREPVYYFIATRRYKLFGKFDACMVPTPSTRKRFLP